MQLRTAGTGSEPVRLEMASSGIERSEHCGLPEISIAYVSVPTAAHILHRRYTPPMNAPLNCHDAFIATFAQAARLEIETTYQRPRRPLKNARESLYRRRRTGEVMAGTRSTPPSPRFGNPIEVYEDNKSGNYPVDVRQRHSWPTSFRDLSPSTHVHPLDLLEESGVCNRLPSFSFWIRDDRPF